MPVPVKTNLIFTPKIECNETINSEINWENTKLRTYKETFFKEQKMENIERCVGLLEHIGNCHNLEACKEGESCRRTKGVLAHYYNCPVMARDCIVCKQFHGLCQIHNMYCKSGKDGCKVPTCKNQKPQQLQKVDKMSRVAALELFKALHVESSTEKKERILQIMGRQSALAVNLMKQLLKKQKFCKVGLAQAGNLGRNSHLKLSNDGKALDSDGNHRPVQVRAKVLIKTLPKSKFF